MAGRAKATSTTDARHRQSGRADSGRGSRESSHDRAQCRFASGDAAGRRCRRDCPAVVSGNGERQCPGAREGLSCTRFEYANLLVSLSGPAVRLTVDLTNVGDRAGRKVRSSMSAIRHPPRTNRSGSCESSPSSRSRRARRERQHSICHPAHSRIGMCTRTPGWLRLASARFWSALFA